MKPIGEVIHNEGLHFVEHSRILAPVRYLTQKGKLRGAAIKTMEDFNVPFSEQLCRDMIWKYCAHQIDMRHYFAFDCEHRSYSEIEEFIGNHEMWYWAWKMNDSGKKHIFDNKYDTYCTFRKYYKRRMIKITSDDDYPEFRDLMLSKGKLVLKPVAAHSGIGVLVVCADTERKARALFNLARFKYTDGFLAEEFVQQCDAMAVLHPRSVNTVRMATIRHDNYVRIWHPFFRVAIGNTIADNSGQGGIQAVVDPQTGILGNANDRKGIVYTVHPDTGMPIEGYQIPRWEEAVALAKELAQVVPEVRYIGWDLALTDDGWVIIEGNSTALTDQDTSGIGWKKEFKQELRKIRRGE